MNERIKITKLKKVFTIILVVLPIIEEYDSFYLPIMDVVALAGIIISVVSGHFKMKDNKILLIYVLYTIVDTFLQSVTLNSVIISDIVIRMIRVLILYFFFFGISRYIFDYEYAFKIYTILVYFISIAVIIQNIIFIVFGVDINLLIPNIPINYGNYRDTSALMHSWHLNASIGYFRPCTFFLEPAHQAQYCLPWLALAFFTGKFKQFKHSFVYLLLVTVGICFTTSSLGIFAAAILWLYYIVKSLMDKKGKFPKQAIIFIPILLAAIVMIFTQENVSNQVLSKFYSVGSAEGGSFSWRILRGIACFKEFGVINHIFGCGYGNVADFLIQNRIYTIYDSGLEVVDYMNGASRLLCSLGIVGFILYAFLIKSNLLYDFDSRKKSLFICFIIIMFTSSLFDSAIYFLMVMLFKHMKDNLNDDRIYRVVEN